MSSTQFSRASEFPRLINNIPLICCQLEPHTKYFISPPDNPAYSSTSFFRVFPLLAVSSWCRFGLCRRNAAFLFRVFSHSIVRVCLFLVRRSSKGNLRTSLNWKIRMPEKNGNKCSGEARNCRSSIRARRPCHLWRLVGLNRTMQTGCHRTTDECGWFKWTITRLRAIIWTK